MIALARNISAVRAEVPPPATPPELAAALDWYFDTLAGSGQLWDRTSFWTALGWRDAGHFEYAVWTAYCARIRPQKQDEPG